jgi:hypothetical protein
MGFDLTLQMLAILVIYLAAFGICFLWFDRKFASHLQPSAQDPILVASGRVTICESQEPYIPMPDHLKTHGEMVHWMTEELPKLSSKPVTEWRDEPRT